MKDTTKRICALCDTNRTPLHGGLYQENDRRGDALGLFGECCVGAVRQAVDESPLCYQHGGAGWILRADVRKKILGRAKEILTAEV